MRQMLSGGVLPSDIAITPPPALRAAIRMADGPARLEIDADARVSLAALAVVETRRRKVARLGDRGGGA